MATGVDANASRCPSRWYAYGCGLEIGHSGMHATLDNFARWLDVADTRETIDVCMGNVALAREEGATEERERAPRCVTFEPGLDGAGAREMADRARDIASLCRGPNVSAWRNLADSLDAAAVRLGYVAAEAQPSDLPARVHSLVNRYTDIWLALGTWDPEGEAAVAECVAILRGILRVERGVLGVDSTAALLERARVDAASMPESLRGRMLTRLVAEVETITRECEAQR
jgi:hypothetical protein